jgi:ribosomal protein S12 methylthiotransferase accessory factor
MISLAAKHHELAKAGVDWCLHFAPLKPERRLLYLTLQTLLQIEMDDTLNTNDYLTNIEKLYGREMVEKSQKLINGFEKFDGLHESDLDLKGFDMHQKLLTSYEKLQRAKRLKSEVK